QMAFQPSESCRGTVDQRSRLRRGPQKMKMPAPIIEATRAKRWIGPFEAGGYTPSREASPRRRTQLGLSMAGAGAQMHGIGDEAPQQEPKVNQDPHVVVKSCQDCHTLFGQFVCVAKELRHPAAWGAGV